MRPFPRAARGGGVLGPLRPHSTCSCPQQPRQPPFPSFRPIHAQNPQLRVLFLPSPDRHRSATSDPPARPASPPEHPRPPPTPKAAPASARAFLLPLVPPPPSPHCRQNHLTLRGSVLLILRFAKEKMSGHCRFRTSALRPCSHILSAARTVPLSPDPSRHVLVQLPQSERMLPAKALCVSACDLPVGLSQGQCSHLEMGGRCWALCLGGCVSHCDSGGASCCDWVGEVFASHCGRGGAC